MKMFHIYVIEYNRFYKLCNCLFPQKELEKLYRFTKLKEAIRKKLYENMFHINVKTIKPILRQAKFPCTQQKRHSYVVGRMPQ